MVGKAKETQQEIFNNRVHPRGTPESIWVQLRSPFLLPCGIIGYECNWERFDADKAGCLLCGNVHKCSQGMVINTCPVEEMEDGAHICTVTGLLIPEVRSSRHEYTETVSFEGKKENKNSDRNLFVVKARVVIDTFVSSSKAKECKKIEIIKTDSRLKQNFIRELKAFKTRCPGYYPSMVDIVAAIVRNEDISKLQKLLYRPRDKYDQCEICRQCANATSTVFVCNDSISPNKRTKQHMRLKVK